MTKDLIGRAASTGTSPRLSERCHHCDEDDDEEEEEDEDGAQFPSTAQMRFANSHQFSWKTSKIY